MKRLMGLAAQYAEALGKAGVLGLGLWVFSVAFAATALAPMHQELDSARAKRERMVERASRLAALAGGRDGQPVSIEVQLARFIGHFPPPDRARQELLELQGFAARHGIQLRSAEYRAANDAGSGLIRHQVAVPVKGSYANVRAFVAEALGKLPTLALDSASFKREAVGAREIEGRLNFTLYSSAS